LAHQRLRDFSGTELNVPALPLLPDAEADVDTDRTLSSVDSRALTEKEQIAGCRETAGEEAPRAVIAVADDDPGARKSLARLLSVFGYHVELFASAEEFQSAALTSKATCLVVDFNLGDVSGLELARWLSAAGFDMPIIFITGSANDTVRTQCMEFGCVAFLQKPFLASLLMEALTNASGSTPQ
jgi:CheY-like chemotaxis protein